MSRSGPIVSPGTSTSFDRSGVSLSPIYRPQVHPFVVGNMGLEAGKAFFTLHEGNVFTGSGFTQNLVQIDSTVTAVNADSPLVLSNANQSAYYTVPLASGSKVLYVRIKRALPSDDWEIKLVCNDSTAAEAEVAANPPLMVGTGETSLGNASHGGFPVNMVTSAGMCGMTYTLTVDQQGKKFRASSAWQGTFVYPVAIFSKLGDSVGVQQILRSDIFFPYSRGTSTEYIDTAVTQITLEASGTCPCGCGCGCGGCGCTCTCGGCGGCGCVPPGC